MLLAALSPCRSEYPAPTLKGESESDPPTVPFRRSIEKIQASAQIAFKSSRLRCKFSCGQMLLFGNMLPYINKHWRIAPKGKLRSTAFNVVLGKLARKTSASVLMRKQSVAKVPWDQSQRSNGLQCRNAGNESPHECNDPILICNRHAGCVEVAKYPRLRYPRLLLVNSNN